MSQTYIPAELKRFVRARSRDRCEYCLIPESVTFTPHWIDHVVAEKHGGATAQENLANSCAFCNQRKGTDLSSIDPATSAIVVLFHPRRDQWADHFRLSGGRIEPLTPSGRATARLLRFNDPERIIERERLVEAGLIAVASGP